MSAKIQERKLLNALFSVKSSYFFPLYLQSGSFWPNILQYLSHSWSSWCPFSMSCNNFDNFLKRKRDQLRKQNNFEIKESTFAFHQLWQWPIGFWLLSSIHNKRNLSHTGWWQRLQSLLHSQLKCISTFVPYKILWFHRDWMDYDESAWHQQTQTCLWHNQKMTWDSNPQPCLKVHGPDWGLDVGLVLELTALIDQKQDGLKHGGHHLHMVS